MAPLYSIPRGQGPRGNRFAVVNDLAEIESPRAMTSLKSDPRGNDYAENLVNIEYLGEYEAICERF
jgi:hypothetical protein